MTFTATELNEHPVWETIARLGQQLDDFDGSGDADALRLMGDTREALAAVASLRAAPAWRFSGQPNATGDPLTSIPPALDGITTFLTSVKQGAYDSDAAMVEAFALALDVLARAANSLFALVPPVTRVESSEALLSVVRADGEAAVSALQRKVDARVKEVEELKARIAEERATFEAVVAEWQRHVSEETTKVTDLTTRLDSAITTQNGEFNTRMTGWEKAASDSLTTQTETLTKALDDSNVRATSDREEQAREADGVLTQLQKHEAEARSLVTKTSRWTITTDYAKYGHSQQKQGVAWSVAAVLVTLGGIVALMVTLSGISGITTGEAIVKTTVTASLIVVGGYMAKLSLEHFRVARDAKRVQLDINALEPFINQFDPNSQQALRNLTAMRVFGRPLTDSDDGGTLFDGMDQALLKQLMKNIKFGPSPDQSG